MVGRFDDIVGNTLRMSEEEGRSKVTTLKEAVRQYVKPGMTLHFSGTHSSTSAAIYEVIRQFCDKDPRFTIIGGMGGIRLNLIHLGMVKKMIGSFFGDGFPMPGPNPIIQKAYREGAVEFENWTMLTPVQRLMAGALGFPFIPTRSIIGSSMAEENKDSFTVMDDPFGSGRKIGLLSALQSDITFVHGLAADRYGNTILIPPLAENLWGAMGCKKGAIVSVEKIVSTEFIRRHSASVRIPGYVVNCVCEEPFAAHPGGLINYGIPELEGYGEDYDFIIEHRQATRDPKALDAWIKHWVLDCDCYRDYLRKLGSQRLLYLKGKVSKNSWEQELEQFSDEISVSEEYSPVEMMTVVGGRKIKEKVLKGDYKTILAGIGVSNLAAWLAYYDLKNEDYDIDLAAEIGFYGYAPRPGDPWIFNFSNIPTCKMATDIHDILGLIVGGENNRALGALGGGQIDKYGNVNSTKVPGELFLVGSGGANDVASAAREVVVMLNQSRGRYLEQVPYITYPGDRVRTLVSTMGVFEKLGDDKELTLTECFADPKLSTLEQRIKQVKEHCGWELKVAPKVKDVPTPTLDELKLLRLFDPKGYYLT